MICEDRSFILSFFLQPFTEYLLYARHNLRKGTKMNEAGSLPLSSLQSYREKRA